MITSRFFISVALVLSLALLGCDSGASSTGAGPAEPASASEQTPAPEPQEAAPESSAETRPESGDLPLMDDGPVVVVNNVPISRQLFESQVVMAEASLNTFGSLEEKDAAEMYRQLRLEVLTSLINLELACQEALARGYAPSEVEVGQALESLKNDYEDLGGLYKALDQYGSSEEELTAQLSKNMALKKWQENDFLAQIKVTDEEAKAFYDNNQHLMSHGELVRASQIFISVPLLSPPQAKEAARGKAQRALKRLADGDDFGTVAAELSDDPEARSDRGDMGWMEKGQSMPLFDQAVFNRLKPGQHSEIQESPMGFHIFKVTETKAAGVDPFPEVKEDIREFLSGEKLEEALMKKMAELHQRAAVEVLDPDLKSAYEAALKGGWGEVVDQSSSVEKKLVRPPQGAAD